MRFAYADPPYYGSAKKLYSKYHSDAAQYDDIDAHKDLFKHLESYPDGWALSMTSGNLKDLLPLAPSDVRVMAWVKPFSIFKPNVNPSYSWEPVLVRGGRRRGRGKPTVRDWCSVNIALKKGLTGAKPKGFCFWLFEVLGAEPGDEIVDLFPGTGILAEAWDEYMVDYDDARILSRG